MLSLAFVRTALASSSASFIRSVNSLTNSSEEGRLGSKPIRGCFPESRKKEGGLLHGRVDVVFILELRHWQQVHPIILPFADKKPQVLL